VVLGRDNGGSPLEAQYNSDSGSDAVSSPFDVDGADGRSPGTSIDSESDIAVHNPLLYVSHYFRSCPNSPSIRRKGRFRCSCGLCFLGKLGMMVSEMSLTLAQQNPGSVSALIHHQDTVLLREVRCMDI